MHRGFTRTLTKLTLSLPLLILVAATASATTFVAVPDPQLAAAAPVIVEGTVLSLDPSRGPGRPATEVAIQVERVLQGPVGDGRLAVRVPGGPVTGQGGLLVWGAPSFRLGEGLSELHQHAPVLCVPELGALKGHSYDGAVSQGLVAEISERGHRCSLAASCRWPVAGGRRGRAIRS